MSPAIYTTLNVVVTNIQQENRREGVVCDLPPVAGLMAPATAIVKKKICCFSTSWCFQRGCQRYIWGCQPLTGYTSKYCCIRSVSDTELEGMKAVLPQEANTLHGSWSRVFFFDLLLSACIKVVNVNLATGCSKSFRYKTELLSNWLTGIFFILACLQLEIWKVSITI